MAIRAGILTVPRMDEDAVAAVKEVLHTALPALFVLIEQSAGNQRNWIADTLMRWADEEELDLVLTIGGTMPAPGPSAAEIVPEATLDVLERLVPGLPEMMRAYAADSTSLALLDRGVAGIRGRTLIVNLPGGADAAPLFLEAVADLLDACVSLLQERSAPPSPLQQRLEEEWTDPDAVDAEPADAGGLDAAEFAAFLARRKDNDSEEK